MDVLHGSRERAQKPGRDSEKFRIIAQIQPIVKLFYLAE